MISLYVKRYIWIVYQENTIHSIDSYQLVHNYIYGIMQLSVYSPLGMYEAKYNYILSYLLIGRAGIGGVGESDQTMFL